MSTLPLTASDFDVRPCSRVDDFCGITVALRSKAQLGLFSPEARNALRSSIVARLPKGAWLTADPEEISENEEASSASLVIFKIFYETGINARRLKDLIHRAIARIMKRPKHMKAERHYAGNREVRTRNGFRRG